MGGSAQETIATCIGLATQYETILIHGSTRESLISREERTEIEHRLTAGKRRGINIITSPWLVRRISPFSDCLALIHLWRCITKEKPDVVHTHTSKAGVLGRIAAHLAGVNIIIHTPHGHVFEGHFGKLLSAIFLWIERLMDRWTTITIALTNGEIKDYLNLGVTCREKLSIIHSGIDITAFSHIENSSIDFRRQYKIPEKAPIIGSIGWLIPVKGPDLLLEAMGLVWNRFPNAVLIFVGKGELLDTLKEQIHEKYYNKHVIFLGWRNDIPLILSVLDILVLPSRNEGMGRVLVEAMAAGKPVVGADVGGIPHLIEPMNNGLLFPKGNVPALAEAISYLIASPEEVARMGANGRAMCDRFSTEKMLDKLVKLYQSLLAQQRVN